VFSNASAVIVEETDSGIHMPLNIEGALDERQDSRVRRSVGESDGEGNGDGEEEASEEEANEEEAVNQKEVESMDDSIVSASDVANAN